MSIEDAIGAHATGFYVVTRTPEGAYEDGILVPSDPDDEIEITITGADDTLDTLTSAAHGLATGDGPVSLTLDTSGDAAPDLPDPLNIDDEYWVIVVDADTIKLAESEADAIAETAIDLTDVGTAPFEASSTRFTIEASVQPLGSGRTLSADDETDTTSEDKLCLCVVELFTRKPGREPDSVEIGGESYTVWGSEYWQHWGTEHYECELSRDEVT